MMQLLRVIQSYTRRDISCRMRTNRQFCGGLRGAAASPLLNPELPKRLLTFLSIESKEAFWNLADLSHRCLRIQNHNTIHSPRRSQCGNMSEIINQNHLSYGFHSSYPSQA